MSRRVPTALLPVTVAMLLIAFCVAGAQMYSSSAGSAALGTQLDETCRTDSALILPITPGDTDQLATVEQIGEQVTFVDPPRHVALAVPVRATGAAISQRLTLIWIDGIDTTVTPAVGALGDGEVAVSAGNLELMETAIGDSILFEGGRRVTVTQSFDDLPFTPVPDFWCGHSELLEPTPRGDAPPPYAIASLETIRAFAGEAAEYLEYRVTDDEISLADIARTQAGYAAASEAWQEAFRPQQLELHDQLQQVVERAAAVRLTTDRNLAPVMLIGPIAGGVVLVAAAVLVARDQRRQLRLLAVRGMPPWRIGATMLPRLSAAIAVGAVAGLVLAWLAVTLFGPSPAIEAAALRRAVLWVVGTTVIAVVVASAVIAVVADGFGDARTRRIDRRIPAGLVIVGLGVLAVLSFRRLDGKGGVRIFGVESKGGDLLAMGFPLFCVLAVTALAGAVVAALAPRLRLTGHRLQRSVRLGWRRVVLEPGPLAAVIVASALAAGCFTVSNALASGASRQLADKADVYVGSDLSITVIDPVEVPAAWEPRTTLVTKTKVELDGNNVELIGVDRQRFPEVARLRGDASPLSLEQMMEAIAPTDGEIRAIGIDVGVEAGELLTVELRGTQEPVQIRIVETAAFFPGKAARVPMIVVDRDVRAEITEFAQDVLLVRDPPPNAVAIIREGDVRTGVVLDAATSFDGSAYSALRWAYAPLATLGGLFAVVALALQLLVVSARREQRRIAHAVMRRTGFGRRGLWVASFVETCIPLVAGCLVGIGAAVQAASLAVPRLDPMPTLAPPAQFLVPWGLITVMACVVPIWSAAIAGVIVRSTTSGDPMRVFQGSV